MPSWSTLLSEITCIEPYKLAHQSCLSADYFLVRSHVQPAVQAFANNFPSILANCYSVM